MGWPLQFDAPSRARSRGAVACALTLAMLLAASLSTFVGSGTAATSSVVVTLQVASATSLDVSACASGGAATAFGTVLPGTTAVTGAPCTVAWGSSNDTSMLRMFQADRRGNAMYRLSDGTFASGFDLDGAADGIGIQIPLAIAYDHEGRTVVAGWYEVAGDKAMAFMRFNPNGSPDLSCSADGLAELNLTIGQWDTAFAIAVDQAGDVLLGGGAASFASDDAIVARFNEADCSLDTTFATNGVATVVAGGGNRVYAMEVMDDGRILLGGEASWGGALFRLRDNGSLDPTFSGDGVLPASGRSILGATTLRDGRIAAVGYDALATQDSIVQVFSAAGVPDAGFNGTGRLTLATAAGDDRLTAVDETPDGKLVVAGSTWRGADTDLHVARIGMAGALDTTFNATGEAVHALAGTDTYFSVVAHGDGRISAIGNLGAAGAVVVTRHNSNGSPDKTLDGDGTLVTGTGPGVSGADYTSPGVIGDDGSYLITGDVVPFRVMKLASGGAIADYQNTINDWNAGASMLAACLAGTTGSSITATWTPAGTCDGVDTDPWYPIAVDGAGPTAKVAQTTVANTLGSQAHLRFGVRVIAGQAPDSYLAPVALEVVAPAV